MFEQTELFIVESVMWLKLGIELIGALIIAVGIVVALWHLAVEWGRGRSAGFSRVRLELARFLALALEFQLAADILSTAVAPSWQQIGQLGAIAVIRTGLNFFLQREMREEPMSERH